MVDWHSYIMWDAMNVIVGMTGDKAQLAAFSLNYNIFLLDFSFIYGINVLIRTLVNYAIGRNDFKYFEKVFHKSLVLAIINGFIFLILDHLIYMYSLHGNNIDNPQVKEYIRYTRWLLYINVVFMGLSEVFKGLIRAFNHLVYLMVLLLICDGIGVILAYYCTIPLGYGIYGLHLAILSTLVTRIIGYWIWYGYIFDPHIEM